MIPDATGEFSRLLGKSLVSKDDDMLLTMPGRYANVVNDKCQLESLFEEPGKCDNLTSA